MADTTALARQPNGLFAVGNASGQGGGKNQYSPEHILKRRLSLAVARKIAEEYEANPDRTCIESHADAVVDAIRTPLMRGNLELLKLHLPQGAFVDPALDAASEADEEASADRWSRLAVEYDLRQSKATAITVPDRSLKTFWLKTRTGRRPPFSLPIVGFKSAQ